MSLMSVNMTNNIASALRDRFRSASTPCPELLLLTEPPWTFSQQVEADLCAVSTRCYAGVGVGVGGLREAASRQNAVDMAEHPGAFPDGRP